MGKKLLAGATTASNWTSLAGALEGALRFLGETHDRATVMGISGHAFRLGIATDGEGIAADRSPIAFDFERALHLYANLGRKLEHLPARPGDRDYARRRDEAIRRIRRSIDHGAPIVAHGLHLPEFGLVKGYDDQAGLLYVSTLVSPQYGEALPVSQWPSPGQVEWIEVILIGDRRRVDRRTAEREALAFAIAYAEHGDPVAPKEAAHGFAAYERWLEGYAAPGSLAPSGNARCIQIAQAARRDAACFLRDIARDYSPGVGAALKQAATAYDAEALALSRLATLFPYPLGGDIQSAGTLAAGAASLRQAYQHEREAISHLRTALGNGSGS